MRIATKTLIVVMVCLVGAALSTGVVFVYYNQLEETRYQREISLLALRDTENFSTITSQWFVTIDLFFFEKQGYLASGIKKQALQMRELLATIKNYKNTTDDKSLTDLSQAIDDIYQSVDAASIIQDQSGDEFNQHIDLMDDRAGIIIEEIEILVERYQEISTQTQASYLEKSQHFKRIVLLSIIIYLFFAFMSWIWASKNIARPVEALTDIANNADINEEGLSFIPNKGSKEVILLGKSLQIFYENLFQSRQKAENRKKELQQSLDELAETKLQLVQSEKLASVGQLASGVAHEINNPIGFISGNFNVLKGYTDDLKEIIDQQSQLMDTLNEDNDSLDENLLAQLDSIQKLQEQKDVEFIIEDLSTLLNDSHDGLERVKKIVSDLMEFSHVNAPDLTEVDINNVIDKAISVMGEQNTTIEFRKNFSDIPKIICHGAKIAQALMNIMINANEAIINQQKTNEGHHGIIQITTQSQHEKIYIDIQDNGCGVSEDNITRIFDPFYTTKPIGEGTGLGLHIAQSILDNHNGRLFAISQINTGTKIRIELPLDPEAQ